MIGMVIEDRLKEYGGGGGAVHMIGLKGDKYRSREGYFVIFQTLVLTYYTISRTV